MQTASAPTTLTEENQILAAQAEATPTEFAPISTFAELEIPDGVAIHEFAPIFAYLDPYLRDPEGDCFRLTMQENIDAEIPFSRTNLKMGQPIHDEEPWRTSSYSRFLAHFFSKRSSENYFIQTNGDYIGLTYRDMPFAIRITTFGYENQQDIKSGITCRTNITNTDDAYNTTVLAAFLLLLNAHPKLQPTELERSVENDILTIRTEVDCANKSMIENEYFLESLIWIATYIVRERGNSFEQLRIGFADVDEDTGEQVVRWVDLDAIRAQAMAEAITEKS